ncbi:MAG: hypothetical protein R2865_02565 [Deinococcales bacterium]
MTGGIGYPTGFLVGGGIEDILNNSISLRVTGAIDMSGSFDLTAQALINMSVDMQELSPIRFYGAAGPSLSFDGVEGVPFGVELTLGGEYRLGALNMNNMGVYAEAGTQLQLIPGFDSGFFARAGVNVHFK